MPSAETSDTLFVFPGAVNEYLGSEVRGLGDLNGDGLPDFAAISNTGPAYVYSDHSGEIIQT